MAPGKDRACFFCSRHALDGAHSALIQGINHARLGMETKVLSTFWGWRQVDDLLPATRVKAWVSTGLRSYSA
jgi:hypothetical protein